MSKEKPLSTRQQNILRFIWEYNDENDSAPSIREIGEATDITSTSVVNYNLKRLTDLGYLIRKQMVARGLQLTDLARAMFETKPVMGKIDELVASLFRVPLLGNIRAGEPIDINDSSFQTYDDDDSIGISTDMLPRNTDDIFALRVDGNSMIDDMINDGDIVIMEKAERADDGTMVAAWVEGEGTTLKRIYGEPKTNKVRLQPANPLYDPIIAPVEDVRVQGRVLMVLRQTA
jgi:repressor LexA